jgi:hypothetical protein
MINKPTKFFPMNPKVVFIFVFALCLSSVWAKDERSIKDLRDALVALAPDVDPGEAELVSVTAHTASRDLAREYRVVLNPSFQNFLVNIGAREKGYCAHYVRDIGSRLKEFKLKTLVLHWGAADPKGPDESNCLVVTARNQPFQDGIVLDAWRMGGRLFWSPIKKDHEYEVRRDNPLNQLAQHRHSGITEWKEDMQETAWLQDYRPSKTEPRRLDSDARENAAK